MLLLIILKAKRTHLFLFIRSLRRRGSSSRPLNRASIINTICRTAVNLPPFASRLARRVNGRLRRTAYRRVFKPSRVLIRGNANLQTLAISQYAPRRNIRFKRAVSRALLRSRIGSARLRRFLKVVFCSTHTAASVRRSRRLRRMKLHTGHGIHMKHRWRNVTKRYIVKNKECAAPGCDTRADYVEPFDVIDATKVATRVFLIP